MKRRAPSTIPGHDVDVDKVELEVEIKKLRKRKKREGEKDRQKGRKCARDHKLNRQYTKINFKT